MDEQLPWIHVGLLSTSYFSGYCDKIGIYRASLDGKVILVGKATEIRRGGLKKRLEDFRRNSESARATPKGRILFGNMDRVRIDVLVYGQSEEEISEIERLRRVLKRTEGSLIKG